jgi:DNA-binding FadR family transcriptional regulator
MSKERLYQSVARDIQARIDAGEFPVGSRLPGERELAEMFNVSRVTIREAEIALEALGLISIKTGSGVYVRQRSDADRSALPDVSAFELTAARAIIEAEAAALAAAHITDAGVKELQALVAKMSKTPTDDESGEETDRQFHFAIARIANNPVIEHFVHQLWRIRNEAPRVRRIYQNVCSKDAGARTDEHKAILDALAKKDPSAARAAMREHFHRLFEALMRVSETEALAEVERKMREDRERFLVTTRI